MALLLLSLAACAPQSGQNQGTQTSDENQGIIGGSEVTQNTPGASQVLMLASVSDQGLSICSGTLITPRHVLTAAHCADNKKAKIYAVFSKDALIRVRILMNSPGGFMQDPRVARVARVAIHPLWSGEVGGRSKPDGDLAVLALATPPPSDFRVTRIATRKPQARDHVIAVGFGNSAGRLAAGSGTLRSVALPVTDIKPGIIVVSHLGGQIGICNGDSGGPAFSKNSSGELLQVGVSSYVNGVHGNACQNQGAFSAVLDYMTWVRSSVQTL